MMAATQRPCRLTIYVCDSAVHHHQPLSDVIVRRARQDGLSGAAVLRGIEGFGRSGDVHTIRLLDLADHLPLAVVLVDEEARLRDFVHRNDDCIHGQLVTLEPLEIVTNGTRGSGESP